jgi:hypothetical protein
MSFEIILQYGNIIIIIIIKLLRTEYQYNSGVMAKLILFQRRIDKIKLRQQESIFTSMVLLTMVKQCTFY